MTQLPARPRAGALTPRSGRLVTKLRAPPRRSKLVQRPRLLTRLDSAVEPGRKLTLICAPAGFGKTTLITDWVARSGKSVPLMRVTWLSLDSGDNDLSRLLTYLTAALRGLGSNSDLPDADWPPPQTIASAEATLTPLINDLAETEGHVVLVLDDYHEITAAEAQQAVTFLIDHLPSQLHLVLATRSDPNLPLSRLRTRDELVEVRAAELSFTVDEAAGFLNQVMDLGLSSADVGALEARTEGWVAGLQLAGLSLAGRTDPSRFIDAFTGSSRFILDYLVDEVLTRQAPPVRDFLLHTSVLDGLTDPLCDAVTGREDSGAMLEHLDRTNLFIVPLDDRRSWYRYHHLFADMLRARMLSQEPDLVPELHRRASAWYAQHDFGEDAVRHALAGRDFGGAAYLMELALPDLRRRRRDTTLLGWLRALPDEVVRRSPVLSVFYGWMLMVSGDLDAAESRFDDAERGLAAEGNPSPSNAELRTLPATLAVHRAALAQTRGDSGATANHARLAYDLAEPHDHFARGSAAGFLGIAAWTTGEVTSAVRTFSEAVQHLYAAGNLADALSSAVVLADMWLAAGRPITARRVFQQALRRATTDDGTQDVDFPLAALHVGLAELDRELGDLAGAAQHLETARSGGAPAMAENAYRWELALANLRLAEGNAGAAVDLLDQAERHDRPGFVPDVRPIAAIKARVRIGQGSLSEADAWSRECSGLAVPHQLSYLHEYEQLTVVRLLIARHRFEPAAAPIGEALELLDRMQHAAAGSARFGSQVEIGITQALAHDAIGDRHAAVNAVKQALAAAPEQAGYARLFLDEGEAMVSLLQDPAHRSTYGDHAQRILRAGRPSTQIRVFGSEELSDREQQVLRLLDSTLTGPEIARALFITVNTLRTHTKHIFTKLDVTSRPAAVLRARNRDLL